jgi:hypothetical protein
MIELRWITRHIQDGSEKVLQYRQQVQKTIYYAVGVVPEEVKETVWSAWKDVPEL